MSDKAPGQRTVELASLQSLTVWRWLATEPDNQYRTATGSVVSADISGFTRLAERLAELGVRQAAEALNNTINRCFEPMIEDVLSRGGDILKFGGDAIFAIFEGPDAPTQASMAAAAMQRHLAAVDLGTEDRLTMTVGVATGDVPMALAGSARRELIVHGAVVDECLQLESDAEQGEVLISPDTAAQLPTDWYDEPEPGILILADLTGDEVPPASGLSPGAAVAAGLDPDHCSRVLGEWLASAMDAYAGVDGELRVVTVAFIFVPTNGDDSATPLRVVEQAIEFSERYGTTLLGTDVSRGGIKLLLTAGAPLAGDDDEDAMLSTISDLVLAPQNPTMKAGVNRGLVYAGFLGSAACRVFTVMGDPTNLAARLLGKADDRSVAVSAAVLDRARNHYNTEELAPVLVKGRIEPVTVHRLGDRTGQRQEYRLRPSFVGRTTELEMLRDAVEQIRSGTGRPVDLLGEGGIGVSRLLDEFISRLPAGVLHFDLTGGIATQSQPFQAIRPFLRALAGIQESMSPAEAGPLLRDWVERIDATLLDRVPLVAPAFEADVPMTDASASVELEFQADLAMATLVSLIEGALTVPTVVVMRDTHWLDPASRDAIAALATASKVHPWLIVSSGRPGVETIGDLANAVLVGALHSSEAEAIVAEVSDLPRGRQQEVARRSGGNPLFAIELATSTERNEQLHDSIEGLVTARIDRLGHQSRVLIRTAAVLGERFEISLLDELTVDAPAGDLDELGELVTDDGDGWASFRSTVIRDVAYEGLSMRRRRDLHAMVATALERRGADVASLARHHGLAANHHRCWEYSRLSAARAIEIGRAEDGFDHLSRAVAAADKAQADGPGEPEPPIDPDAITAALTELYYVGVAARRTQEAVAAGERALARIDDRADRTKLLVFLATTAAETEGSYAAQIDRLQKELDGCDPGPADAAIRARIGGTLAALLYRADQFDKAMATAAAAIDAATTANETTAMPQALLVRQLVLAERMAPERFEAAELLIAVADAAKDYRILSSAHNNVGLDYAAIGDWRKAGEHYELSASAAQDIGDNSRAMFPAMNKASLLLDQGHWSEARQVLDEGRRVARHYENGLMTAWCQMELGRLETNAGRPAEARGLVNAALAWLEEAGIQSLILEAKLNLLAADLADGRSGDVLAAADDIEVPEELSGHVPGWLNTVLGYAKMQQGRAEEALVDLERAVAETEDTNLYRHALALAGRSEAEGFLGHNRASRRTRAAADEILASLEVATLPVIPLPK